MQDDELEEEEDEYEESEDGFVVPNGYISEDEGLGSVQQSLNDLCADLEGAHPRPGPGLPGSSEMPKILFLAHFRSWIAGWSGNISRQVVPATYDDCLGTRFPSQQMHARG